MTVSRLSFAAGFVWAIVSCILWSGNYVLGKLLMSEAGVSAASVSFWRFFWGGLAMLAGCVILKGVRSLFALSRRDWLEIAGQGFFGMCAVGLLMFQSESMTSAINASMLDALIPVAILLGGLFCGERLSTGQCVGMALSLLGCLLVIRVLGAGGLHLTRLGPGDLLIVAAAICWAVYVLWGRRTLKRVDSLIYTAWAMVFGMASTLCFSVADRQLLAVPDTPFALWLLAGMIVGPTVGAFFAWNLATKILPLSILNILQYLIPVAAILFAHFLLLEPLGVWQISGMVLIVGGVGLDPTVTRWLKSRL